ncbi:DUF1828 domain-containing protein [Weissella koreensis]|uniref:DUF1828 domain-containing protein n=1 Tax=Weissella koreensis TaxID=165096 RepID=UPI0022BA67E5|nr:DUF1828 domain-containing protein [Weissella koreensis]MCZ9310656.1 DUF1828 domain-containing protein [Weissella koreensis]
MTIDALLLKNNYYKWLQQDLIFSDLENGFISISTPFVDSNFDNINLYVEVINQNQIKVTDLGYTIFNLESAGIILNGRTKTKNMIIDDTISKLGINLTDGVLSITTTLDHFAQSKNRLLQGVMRINDILFLNKSNIKNSFSEIISDMLTTKNVFYNKDVEIPGASGVSSFFDIIVPNNNKERLVRTVSRPNDLNQAKAFNYDVQSVSQNRDSLFVYVYDDTNANIKINDSISTSINTNVDEKTTAIVPASSIPTEKKYLVNV